MPNSWRPYIGKTVIGKWRDRVTGEVMPGIKLMGSKGLAAVLTADQARELADTLHDLSDKLDGYQEPPQPPPAPRLTDVPLHTSYSALTAADGTEEPPLPATIAD